jgi:hypothetical protein
MNSTDAASTSSSDEYVADVDYPAEDNTMHPVKTMLMPVSPPSVSSILRITRAVIAFASTVTSWLVHTNFPITACVIVMHTLAIIGVYHNKLLLNYVYALCLCICTYIVWPYSDAIFTPVRVFLIMQAALTSFIIMIQINK